MTTRSLEIVYFVNIYVDNPPFALSSAVTSKIQSIANRLAGKLIQRSDLSENTSFESHRKSSKQSATA